MRSISAVVSRRFDSMESNPDLVVSKRRQTDHRCRTFYGDCESDADGARGSSGADDRSDDANHFTARCRQRATGVTGVCSSVELNQICKHVLAIRREIFAMDAGDDAGRERGTNAEWKAHSNRLVARMQVRGRMQDCRHDLMRCVRRPDHCQIVLGFGAEHFRFRLRTVREYHSKLLACSNHMEVSQYGSILQDDYARADIPCRSFLRVGA